MAENYGPGQRIVHRANTNSAKWRIVQPDYPRGTIIRGDSNRGPGSVWVILIFFALFSAIGGGRLLLRQYKKWKSSKQTSELNE